MSSLSFTKMEGCGNDFVVAYRHELPEAASPSSAKILCDRTDGVGADGVLVIDWGPSLSEADQSEGAIARMTVWNADGSIAEMCGNGLRCVVRRLAEDGKITDSEAIIMTGAGPMPVALRDTMIRVATGRPTLPKGNTPQRVQWNEHSLEGLVVSMGNPHFVLFEQDLPKELPDLTVWGPDIEVNPAFPQRTNVEWVQVKTADPGRVRMRVWERGVGETQACGSGACAVAVAARVSGRIEGESTQVELPGGVLQVDWSGDYCDFVFIEGPANTVFKDEWEGQL
jgi:diaminopimelate epimerase